MATTDDELDALRESVESKRNELAEARRARAEQELGTSNDITAAQLRAEEARLDAELATVAATVKANQGPNPVLTNAEDAMRASLQRTQAEQELADARQQQAAAEQARVNQEAELANEGVTAPAVPSEIKE